MTLEDHERENYPNLSTIGMPFAVGFYFAFRVAIVLLSVRILGTTPQSGAAINLGLNFFFLALTAFIALGNVRIPIASMTRLPDARWVFAFLCFSGCSLLWTGAVSWPAAVAYWCAMAADVAITVMLLRAGPLRAAAESLMKGYVWGACTFAIIAWLLPAQSDLRLGDEELLGPNQIGYLCAFVSSSRNISCVKGAVDGASQHSCLALRSFAA
jgi:exopolysaccharide production protein ExoQ